MADKLNRCPNCGAVLDENFTVVPGFPIEAPGNPVPEVETQPEAPVAPVQAETTATEPTEPATEPVTAAPAPEATPDTTSEPEAPEKVAETNSETTSE
jgi:hypothetical protein